MPKPLSLDGTQAPDSALVPGVAAVVAPAADAVAADALATELLLSLLLLLLSSLLS